MTIAPIQSGPNVWRREDVGDPTTWTHQLSAVEIDALVATDPGAPPPPAARELVGDLTHELLHGRAFQLVSGFPSRELGDDACANAFTTLGGWLGSPRSQNASGDLLGHVRNVGADVADPAVRIYQTNRRQTFHTDSTDVVGLMCLETAAEGGESLLASAGAIYNEMLCRDAELAAELFEPIATDRRGEVPDGADPWFNIPVLSWFGGHLTVLYQRQYIESAQRFDEVGGLGDRTVAALDLFDEIANDTAFHLSMELEPGDMQFVHNHSLLHDRTAFVDRPGSPRHLLRLWLSMPGDRELPPVFAERYGTTDIGRRGGIIVG